MQKDDRFRGAERICSTLQGAGHRALLAGGCVRDMLLEVEPKDYDIATSARPNDVASLFEKTVPVGVEFGVQLVVLPEGSFEVATFRVDGPYLDGRHPSLVHFCSEMEDALRRDFTINALFYDPADESIIDYVGGQWDLRQGFVRAVGEPMARFAEDRLRLLRAVRFAARFGYSIEPQTYAALTQMVQGIHQTSPERIRDEFLKMLTEGRPRSACELLDNTGLLHEIVPEVERMKGVEQAPVFHPEGDVFVHAMCCLDHLRDPSPELAMAVLLHDAGKPLTQTFEDRIRFSGHDRVGAEEARRICRRLKMSRVQTDRIAWLIENHMRMTHVPDMRESKRKRFVREEAFADLIELCRADALGSHGNLDIIHWIEDYLGRLQPEEIRPVPLLSGVDLISMGYEPGPLFTKMLAEVEDAQLEGHLTTKQQAEDFVRSRW